MRKIGKLYRHFNESGQLLYVGVSFSFLQRTCQHQRSHWFNEVATISIQTFRTKKALLRAEKIAIQNEKPLYNLKTYSIEGKTDLSVDQLSKYIGVSKRTMYRMIKDRRFPVEPIEGSNPSRWCIEKVEKWRMSGGKIENV